MSEILIEIKIEPLDEGGGLATSDELQGLLAQGRAVAETMEIAQDVARKLIQSYIKHGDPLPENIRDALSGNISVQTNSVHVCGSALSDRDCFHAPGG